MGPLNFFDAAPRVKHSQAAASAEQAAARSTAEGTSVRETALKLRHVACVTATVKRLWGELQRVSARRAFAVWCLHVAHCRARKLALRHCARYVHTHQQTIYGCCVSSLHDKVHKVCAWSIMCFVTSSSNVTTHRNAQLREKHTALATWRTASSRQTDITKHLRNILSKHAHRLARMRTQYRLRKWRQTTRVTAALAHAHAHHTTLATRFAAWKKAVSSRIRTRATIARILQRQWRSCAQRVLLVWRLQCYSKQVSEMAASYLQSEGSLQTTVATYAQQVP